MTKQTYLGIPKNQALRTQLGRKYSVSVPDIVFTSGDMANVFFVNNGPVLLLAMFMEITEVVSNDACNMSWVSDSKRGSDTDIGADVNIQAAAAGDWFWAECDATAIVKAAQGTVLPLLAVDRQGTGGRGLVVPEGDIDIDLSTQDPTTGKGTIYCIYEPLVEGASITAGDIVRLQTSSTTTTSTTTTTSSTTSSTSSTASTTSSTSSTTSSSTTTSAPP